MEDQAQPRRGQDLSVDLTPALAGLMVLLDHFLVLRSRSVPDAVCRSDLACAVGEFALGVATRARCGRYRFEAPRAFREFCGQMLDPVVDRLSSSSLHPFRSSD